MDEPDLFGNVFLFLQRIDQTCQTRRDNGDVQGVIQLIVRFGFSRWIGTEANTNLPRESDGCGDMGFAGAGIGWQ